MILTPRDLNLMGALNNQVRLLTLAQIAEGWWSPNRTGRKNAAKRLKLLAGASFLNISVALARPLLAIEAPEVAWRMGDPPPQFGQHSWRLKVRWSLGPRRIRVYYSGPRSLGLLGGATPGMIKNLCQVTHDLHVGQVLLVFRRRWPEHAAAWVGEDVVAPLRIGQILPDAMLIDTAGMPYRAVEFGGGYPPRRLQAFHDDCARRNLPYEIW